MALSLHSVSTGTSLRPGECPLWKRSIKMSIVNQECVSTGGCYSTVQQSLKVSSQFT